jgi:hypothetical protein
MTTQRPARRIPRALVAAALTAAALGALAVLAAAPATAADEAPAVATNGVVIHWNSGNQQFEAPSAEQAASLWAELQLRLSGEVAAKAGLASGPVSTEKLPNGMTRARLPLDLLNLSIVHVGTDGSFAESCTQDSPAEVDLAAGARTTETSNGWEVR